MGDIANESPKEPMTYLGHLAELRKRIIWALAVFLVAATACFTFAEKLADFLMIPAQGLKFVYLSPPDLFVTYIKLALISGLVLSLPIIIFEIWMFVSPALKKKERRFIFYSLLLGGGLFIAGAAFSFLVIIPLTIKFFLSYQTAQIVPMFSITDYFAFISNFALSFGVAFEMPIVAGLLGALGILKSSLLVKERKIAILLIFIAAAILTPSTDMVSQILLAIPMMLLYEISVIIVRGQEKRRENKSADAIET
jgi:sec-independent protein translocase protein TatC